MGAELRTEAITSIYDAALTDGNWRTALDAISAAMHSHGSMLYELSEVRTVDFRIDETSSLFADIDDVLVEYNRMVQEGRGSGYDFEGLSATHAKQQFDAMVDTETWTIDDDYKSRPEVRMGMKHINSLRRFIVNLSDDPVAFSGLICFYGRDYDALIPPGDVALARSLAPHIAKATELSRVTSTLRRKYNAVLSVLDRIDVAICVVDETGEIVLKNRVATEVIDRDDGVRIRRDGRLACWDEDETARLSSAIASVSRTARGDAEDAGTHMEITRRVERLPYYAVLSPLRDAGMELEAGLTGALVTLIDPDQRVELRAETLATAYRLTGAEGRLIDHLLKGRTTKEIAERHEVSPETIKTQISSVLQKTGCQNRLSFIWRVFQFSPPVR